MNVLRQFGPDFSDYLVPAWHFMKCLESSGIRCNALIFTKISVLSAFHGKPRHFMKCQISADAYDIFIFKHVFCFKTVLIVH